MKNDGGIEARSTSGKISAVHAQIAVVALMMLGQLWLLTVAWDQLLLGEIMGVVTATVASGIAFLLSLGTLFAYRE